MLSRSEEVAQHVFCMVPVFPVVRSTGGEPPALVCAASCCSEGTIATTVIASLVTPCTVAPPLSLPSAHGTTHTGPVPTRSLSQRPYAPMVELHFVLLIAAAVPMPVPAGGFPAPGRQFRTLSRSTPNRGHRGDAGGPQTHRVTAPTSRRTMLPPEIVQRAQV